MPPRPQRITAALARALFAARVFALCLGSCSIALAGPPFITDDPEPVELRHWEVYLASMALKTPLDRSGTFPHVEVNNGVSPNVQAHIIAPCAFDRAAGEPLHRGYGDTELGLKYRFIQEGRTRPMVGIFPLVELPTGAASRGLGSGHAQWFLPVWLQKSWGPWTTFGGGGYWIHPGKDNRNYWLFGWAVQRDLSEHVTLGGEVLRTTPSATDGRCELAFNLGGYYDFDDEHHLLFSAGRGNADTEFMSYLAFQWTFGPPRTREEKTVAP
jgi:hypothetical protein